MDAMKAGDAPDDCDKIGGQRPDYGTAASAAHAAGLRSRRPRCASRHPLRQRLARTPEDVP